MSHCGASHGHVHASVLSVHYTWPTPIYFRIAMQEVKVTTAAVKLDAVAKGEAKEVDIASKVEETAETDKDK